MNKRCYIDIRILLFYVTGRCEIVHVIAFAPLGVVVSPTVNPFSASTPHYRVNRGGSRDFYRMGPTPSNDVMHVTRNTHRRVKIYKIWESLQLPVLEL
jgi:hypothetical protein